MVLRGSRAIDVRADVSKPDEIEALLDTARSRFGGLDIVVVNAGSRPWPPSTPRIYWPPATPVVPSL